MSKIEVNQISSQCGSTLTIGQSGDTVTLACGATQTGFGRTGTVDWDTTAKTASFTAVSGTGYFVNTTSGAITLTLPATPSAGDIVAFKDYAYTFATNNLTVDGNGSPIGGVDGTILPTYSTNGTSKTFIYVDGTKGWLVTNESTDTSQETNILYVTATGGTITCCGDYKIHTFTGPGTFCVSCAGNPLGSDTIDYFVVAGGGGAGGGSNDGAGGGGAGGFRLSNSTCMPSPQTSPLASPTGLPVTVQGYPITVGGGGVGNGNFLCGATAGSNSIFSTITSAGGGVEAPPAGGPAGGSGGSGAAPRGGNGGISPAGLGNTPPVSPPQGNNSGTSGGTSPNNQAGGGGGAGGVGANSLPNEGGAGGIGSFVVSSGFAGCNGTTGPVCGARYFSGGGGGGARLQGGNAPPAGGGGQGSSGDCGPGQAATSGTTNTGGGGGGGAPKGAGGSGGSGIVIIRYKYQN